MLFNSFEFIVFLPIIFITYWFIPHHRVLQNSLIVIASYIFYGWWDTRFLLLIATTTLCSYGCGIYVERTRANSFLSKLLCGTNLVINLSILCIFKYYNFFIENLQGLLSLFGWSTDCMTLHLILPVGISFYTFQAISYTTDVYRKKIHATSDILAFFAFISFFPQLVAGPIERATHLLPQFLKARTFDSQQASDGLRQILWGFFKKIVVADNCALIVNNLFYQYTELNGLSLWLGALFFTFQIYGDFSGYSDIAIGTAKLFGIQLKRNFNNPYFSRDIAEFWRRWHISLNTWFRDYLYIPLGGSQCNKLISVRNTFIIFLVSGFWHGANWTYVIWGAYHAILFIPLLITGKNRIHLGTVAEGRYLPSIKECAQMLVTFILATIGWVIFRSENIHQAYDYIIRMFTQYHIPFQMPLYSMKTLCFISITILVEWITKEKEHGLDMNTDGWLRHRPLRWMIYYLFVLIILQWGGKQETFIYFQF